jgi:hypothetical protein
VDLRLHDRCLLSVTIPRLNWSYALGAMIDNAEAAD